MRGNIGAKWLIAGFCVVWLASPAWAEKRGVRMDGKAPVDYVAAQYSQSWAVVIGINDYEKVNGSL